MYICTLIHDVFIVCRILYLAPYTVCRYACTIILLILLLIIIILIILIIILLLLLLLLIIIIIPTKLAIRSAGADICSLPLCISIFPLPLAPPPQLISIHIHQLFRVLYTLF